MSLRSTLRTWQSSSSSSRHGNTFVDDVLADLQVLAGGDVGVRAEIDTGRDALRDVDVRAELPFALGQHDEGEPRRALSRAAWSGSGLRSHGNVRRLRTICGSRSRQSPCDPAGGNVDRIWSGGMT